MKGHSLKKGCLRLTTAALPPHSCLHCCNQGRGGVINSTFTHVQDTVRVYLFVLHMRVGALTLLCHCHLPTKVLQPNVSGSSYCPIN